MTRPAYQPEPGREPWNDGPRRSRPSSRDLLGPLERARALQLAGQFEAAEARYRAVLRLDPRQPQALVPLGLLVDSLGRPVEALRILREAQGVQPDMPGVVERIASLLERLGRD